MYEDPKSKISQLQKVLDAREDHVTGQIKRHELHDKEVTIKEDWDNNEFRVGDEISEPVMGQSFNIEKPKGTSLPIKILLGSVVFFIIALAVVAYNFFGGGNLVSGNNIDINVKAPVSISGGDSVPFEVEIKNNNGVPLTGADLTVTYPLGAKEVSDTSLPAKRIDQSLGTILPGQSIKKNLTVALFGGENEKKDIVITLEYKITGSNSLFNKTKTFSVLISSSPVSIVVTGPKEVNTNQSVDFNVEVTSNSSTVIKGLLLKAEYPFGFSFTSATPETFSKDNVWLLGDLEPGAKRTIKFSGVLSGQEDEERGFNFSVGSQSKIDTTAIDVPFSSFFSSVTIKRPFVSADVTFNGIGTVEYVSTAGSKISTVIKWRNNLAYEVSDVSIIVKMNGNAVDKASVQVEDGFYRSIDNTITFSKMTDKNLATLEPGQEGESKFAFNSFGANSVTGAGLTNPLITLDLSVEGRRVDYQNGPEDVLFADSRKIKITSEPQLAAKALYYVGPFHNTGPLPPKAEKETTYTVTWTITNQLNNLSNAKVSATLPPYVKWLGIVSPEKEKMDYDSGTGLLTWNVGNVTAGAGAVVPAREASFQISFMPSVNQIKETPDLVGDSVLTAKDNYTLTTVTDSFSPLNTSLRSDPYFKTGSESVTE